MLETLTPDHAEVGDTPPTVTLTGQAFAADCAVLWNGTRRAVTRDSATTLHLSLLADDLRVPRSHEVQVLNPTGGTSAAKTFVVVGQAPIPRLDTLTPSAARAGSGPLTVQLAGGNFAPTSVVQANGQPRATTFHSTIALEATLLEADLAVDGTVSVTVVTPAPGGGTSAAVSFAVEATSGALVRVSVAEDGSEIATGAGTDFALSSEGRFVAFSSDSDAVTAGDSNGVADVFLRDTCLGGGAGCVLSTRRVSWAADGGQLSLASTVFGVSTGGRFVLLRTDAPDVLEGFAGGQYTFVVRDTCSGAPGGCAPRNLAVILQLDGGLGSSREPFSATLTADGRFVTFLHDQDDLVPDDTNGRTDAFQFDTCLSAPVGCVPSTVRASVAEDGGEGSRGASGVALSSADGRFVTFVSGANDLVANDTSSGGDTFVRDTCRGASACTPTTLKASFGAQGEEAGFQTCNGPAISADGRFVSFQTRNDLGFNDTNNDYEVFLRDTCLGVTGCSPTTFLVSETADGGSASRGSDYGGSAVVSATGRFVAFASEAPDLVIDDPTLRDAFVRDTCLGAPPSCVPTTRVVSRAPGAMAPNDAITFQGPALSADGRSLLFRSAASDLVSQDTNGVEDLFVVSTGF